MVTSTVCSLLRNANQCLQPELCCLSMPSCRFIFPGQHLRPREMPLLPKETPPDALPLRGGDDFHATKNPLFARHARLCQIQSRPFASLQLGLGTNNACKSDCVATLCVLGAGLCSARASCKEPSCWNTFSRDDIIKRPGSSRERGIGSARERTDMLPAPDPNEARVTRPAAWNLGGRVHSSLSFIHRKRPGPTHFASSARAAFLKSS